MIYLNEADSIEILKFPTRIYNCLMRNKIYTVGAFLACTEGDFLAMRNFGRTSLEESLRLQQELRDGTSEYFKMVEYEPDSEDSNEVPGISAAEIIESNTESQKTQSTDSVLLHDIPIEKLDLRVRPLNALKNANITRASQLIGMSLDDLMKIRNMGVLSAKEVFDAIQRITLTVAAGVANEALDSNTERRKLLSSLTGDAKKAFGDDADFWVKKIQSSYTPGDKRESLLTCLGEDPDVICGRKKLIQNYLEEQAESTAPLSQIISYMEQKMTLPTTTSSLIDSMIEENTLSKNGNEVSVVYPSIMEYIAAIQNEKVRLILSEDLAGKTLQETGDVLGVTRERIRQILEKNYRIIRNKGIRVQEDRYLPLLRKYIISREEFCFAFDEPISTYIFLDSVYRCSKEHRNPLKDALTDETISISLRRGAEKAVYKDYLTIDGIRVPHSRPDVVRFIVSHYCREQIVFDDFADLYHAKLAECGAGEDDSLKLESRSYETRFNQSIDYVLWSQWRHFRYYPMEEREFDELLDTLDLEQYDNTVFSTLKFFRDYPDLMKEYDIRDEYELHNLLKKLWRGKTTTNVTFEKMPTIVMGVGSTDNQVLDLLIQYAPLSNLQLADRYEEAYGVRAQTALANLFRNFDEYYHNGIYSIDIPPLSPERFARMRALLTDEFYTIRRIRKIYTREFPDADEKDINPHTLKTLGFHVFSGYVLSTRWNNMTQYCESLLSGDVVDLRNIDKDLVSVVAFGSLLYTWKAERRIVEFAPKQYISRHRLAQSGILPSDLENYCRSVKSFLGEELYFTIRSLRNAGFSHPLDDLGFEDWFYSSVLIEDREHFTYRRMGGTKLLFSGKRDVSLSGFLEDLIFREGQITIYDLVDKLRDIYDIRIDRYKLQEEIRQSDLYYDTIMETVYPDYDTYYEEI